MQTIKELGEHLYKIKERIFAQTAKPEVGAALDAQRIESEEVNATRKKNLRFGNDPWLIEQFALQNIKVPAVFEDAEEDQADSWAAKSVQADASSEHQELEFGDLQPGNDGNQLIREPERNNSDKITGFG